MKYKRILLKLSGESLSGGFGHGIDEHRLTDYAMQIHALWQQGVDVGIVIGGGNIFRGLSGEQRGFDRVRGDQMGMLATVINSLALQNALEATAVKVVVFTSMKIESIGRRYAKPAVLEAFANHYVCIFAGGTGNPYFSTDTAAALRAVEIEADVLLKGTRVDGVYSADPEKCPNATKFNHITYDEVYDKKLKIMDLTAFTLCRENNMPIIVFDMDTNGNLEKIISGETIGTIINNKL